MDKVTYAQPHIAQYITENFYPVKFNAETKKILSTKEKITNTYYAPVLVVTMN